MSDIEVQGSFRASRSIPSERGEGETPVLPVAWLLTHPTEPSDCELAHPFIQPLTDADRDAGWIAVALYARGDKQ